MSSLVPDTRNTLIARLGDQRDAEAWDQFVAIYEPLVYRLARAKGFQDADAREIVQEVLVAVSRAVERWKPDPERGRFRQWLFQIARNLMVNFMSRRGHKSIASGDSRVADLLNQQPDSASEESAAFQLEYRREIFRLAAERVKTEVKESTWQAFWLSSVEQQSITDVAATLDLSVGAVHIARSRVRSRLRIAVQNWEHEEEGPLNAE